MDMGIWALLFFVGAPALVVGYVYIANHVNGDAEIVFDSRAYQPGDTVSADITLKAHQALNAGKVTATLVLERSIEQRENRPSQQPDKCLFETEQLVADRVDIDAGDSRTFRVAFDIPEERPDTNQQNLALNTSARLEDMQSMVDAFSRGQTPLCNLGGAQDSPFAKLMDSRLHWRLRLTVAGQRGTKSLLKREIEIPVNGVGLRWNHHVEKQLEEAA